MIIGIDFDDVLYNFNQAYCTFHNEKYDTSLVFDDVRYHDMTKVWGIDAAESVKRVYEFYVSNHHDTAPPIVGSLDSITLLKKGNSLHIITSRPQETQPQTHAWLKTHFPGVFDAIHFTNLFGNNTQRRLKSDVCKELGITLFIEDSLQQAENIAGIGVPVFLLTTPWNRGEVPKLVTRVNSWDEIIAQIDIV